MDSPVKRTSKQFWITIATLIVVAALAMPGSAAAAVYPNSMASMGDSITRAMSTVSLAVDTPANSWSTGTSTSVNSLYSRFLAANPLISGKAYNDAKSGAKMVDLAGQAATVNSQHVDYVTILMGANDACTSSVSTMTAVTTFRSQFQSAVNSLVTSSPNIRIYVVSIPDVYNLWSVLKNNSSARLVWSLFGICQSLLKSPTSTLAADVTRRAAVRQRVIDFNTQLAEVCALYTQCRFDNNAAFNTVFVASDISTKDYFHPSIAGQAKLANTAWVASGFAP